MLYSMDRSIFCGNLTEEELKKQLNLKLNKLKKLNEAGPVNSAMLYRGFGIVDDLLNELAYKCYINKDLTEEFVETEINDILEKVAKMNVSSEFTSDLEESVELEQESECSTSDEKEEPKDNFKSLSDFNDTLEEMERALNEGLDYKFDSSYEEREPITSENPVDTSETCKDSTSRESIFKESEKPFVDISKMVEQLSTDCLDNYEQENLEEINTKDGSAHFKTPFISKANKFLKPKNNVNALQTPTSSRKQTRKPDFKTPTLPSNKLYQNVISPVAFYIKNSITVPPTIKTNLQEQFQTLDASSTQTNRFPNAKNIVLPEIYYEPAHRRIMSKENTQAIPESIKKIVGRRTEIIIHQARFNKGEKKIKGEAINCSTYDEDISMCFMKEAVIH